MAIFTAVRNKKQTAGTMMGVLKYVTQACKTMLDDQWMVTGHNCVARASYLEMMTTKQQFRKTDGRQFYHFVQSFPAEDGLTPQQVNAIGVEFAQKQFPDFEVVVATHLDTNHLHNHLVVNSVNCKDGKKLHQNAADLQRHRQVNDEICMAHGLQVLEPPKKHTRKKQMRPGEYQAGLRGDSWKLDLIQAINDALEYADDRESFVENMEYEGYEVIWTDTRKHITFVCPDGRRCRDSSLHDETFLKENLETLFAYRQAVIDVDALSTKATTVAPIRLLPHKKISHIYSNIDTMQRQIISLIAHALDMDGEKKSVSEKMVAYYNAEGNDTLYTFQFQPQPVNFEVIDRRIFAEVLYPKDIYDLIDHHIRECVKREVRMRVCKNCLRYFAVTGKASTEYCDRVCDSKGRTCREIGAINTWTQRKQGDEVFKEYRREYKKRFARINAGKLTKSVFYAWSEEARKKKEDCDNGTITPEDFSRWLKES